MKSHDELRILLQTIYEIQTQCLSILHMKVNLIINEMERENKANLCGTYSL